MTTMKVRELQALLADCNPDGTVSLWLPDWFNFSDGELPNADDNIDFCAAFVLDAGLSSSAVESNGAPDRIAITLAPEQRAEVFKERLMARSPDTVVEEDSQEESNEHVIVDVRMSQSTHAAIRRVTKQFNASPAVKAHECSVGVLTVSSLLTTLAEDVAMTDTRPGSWEGSNMRDVLSAHGYR